MKIALVGYGKMGKTIERIAVDRGHKITARADSFYDLSIIPSDTEVAIEFTRPESAVQNIQELTRKGIAVVCGTTGWNDKLTEVQKIIADSNTGLVHASNFSLGVNLFFELNKKLALLLRDYTDYKASMTEVHHLEKKDAPSGTAITLFSGIDEVAKVGGWHLGKQPRENSLAIEAVREKDVKGTHIVRYDSPIDTIEIKHEAHTRDGFALGAVIATEWLQGKRGMFTMKDVLGL